jgi:hypothetical protein
MPDKSGLVELVTRVGAFHITDRAMKRAQEKIDRVLEAGTADEGARSEYFAAVRRYFGGFAQEARDHLHDVDRRLEQINQVHFNLTAERGVAVKRIEATESILRDLEVVERAASA